MTSAAAIDYQQIAPEVLQALLNVHKQIDKLGLAPRIKHLVVLRVSQVNQCAFCVKMHLKEAREDGENNDRLDRLVVWRHCDDFDAKEKTALAWAEALTEANPTADYSSLRVELREYFDEKQITALTCAIGMINFWNRIQHSNY